MCVCVCVCVRVCVCACNSDLRLVLSIESLSVAIQGISRQSYETNTQRVITSYDTMIYVLTGMQCFHQLEGNIIE